MRKTPRPERARPPQDPLRTLPLLPDDQLQLPVRQDPPPGRRAPARAVPHPRRPASRRLARVRVQAAAAARKPAARHRHGGNHRRGLRHRLPHDANRSCLRLRLRCHHGQVPAGAEEGGADGSFERAREHGGEGAIGQLCALRIWLKLY